MRTTLAATLITMLSGTIPLVALTSCADTASTTRKASVSASSTASTATGASRSGGASGAKTASNATRSRPDRGYWRQRTDAEVDLALEQLCAKAETNGKPVLITFSASWCQDCQIMKRLEKDPVVSDEMSHWNRLLIEPGRLDRHVPLLQAFGVSRIAWWVAAKPQDCRLPAPAWERLAEGPFEPSGGKVTAQGLADWLRSARE